MMVLLMAELLYNAATAIVLLGLKDAKGKTSVREGRQLDQAELQHWHTRNDLERLRGELHKAIWQLW